MSNDPIPASLRNAEGGVIGPGGGPATPAATVVALRDSAAGPEVLLLRRKRGGSFSGMWVFPGGKVEPDDFARAGVEAPATAPAGASADASGLALADEIAVARQAAAREAAEEAQLHLDPAVLQVHSYWLPPPEAARRFSTWFFVAPAGPDGAIVVDRTEVHEHRWITPAAAIAERAAGTLTLAPPTFVTLWQIGRFPDVAAAMAAAGPAEPPRFETRLVTSGGGAALLWEGDVAWGDRDLDKPGPRRRLWIADDSPWRLELDTPGPGSGS